MSWRALQSKHLNGRDYEPESKTLLIQFVNGAIYAFSDVPQHIVDTLDQVSSPGEYFHSKIKPSYSSVQVAAGRTSGGSRSRRRF